MAEAMEMHSVNRLSRRSQMPFWEKVGILWAAMCISTGKWTVRAFLG